MSKEEQVELGDTICEILYQVYQAHRRRFQREASKRGISVESLTAAAICGMIDERFPQVGAAVDRN